MSLFPTIVLLLLLGLPPQVQAKSPATGPKIQSISQPTQKPTTSPQPSRKTTKRMPVHSLELKFDGLTTINAGDVVTYTLNAKCTELLVDQVELRVFEIFRNEDDAGGPFTKESHYPYRNFALLDPVNFTKISFQPGEWEEIQFRVRWIRTVIDGTILIQAWGRNTKGDNGEMTQGKVLLGTSSLNINLPPDTDN